MLATNVKTFLKSQFSKLKLPLLRSRLQCVQCTAAFLFARLCRIKRQRTKFRLLLFCNCWQSYIDELVKDSILFKLQSTVIWKFIKSWVGAYYIDHKTVITLYKIYRIWTVFKIVSTDFVNKTSWKQYYYMLWIFDIIVYGAFILKYNFIIF